MRTKSVLLTLLAILFMNLHAAAQDPIKQGHNGKRILVAYFSATGTTAEAAKKLARVTGTVCHHSCKTLYECRS